ncbi:MAG TPA: flagellar basal body rod protein FlgB [Stenotrophomonas sp.]|nr:flagellar basal body rod protein FlgB [Stenotrophomonas sp.]
MSNPIASYLGVHADALPLREQRMQLIASNLSNADTPGYKAQDLDFNAALSAAGAAREGIASPGIATTAEGHIGSGQLAGLNPFQITRQANQPSLDGNTVDPDAERAAYGRAALEYRASLSFIESKVKNMLTAITGS